MVYAAAAAKVAARHPKRPPKAALPTPSGSPGRFCLVVRARKGWFRLGEPSESCVPWSLDAAPKMVERARRATAKGDAVAEVVHEGPDGRRSAFARCRKGACDVEG